MQLYIKTGPTKNDHVVLDIRHDATINSLQSQILKKIRTPLHQQRLFHESGVLLQGGLKLSDYDVKNQDWVDLVVRKEAGNSKLG